MSSVASIFNVTALSKVAMRWMTVFGSFYLYKGSISKPESDFYLKMNIYIFDVILTREAMKQQSKHCYHKQHSMIILSPS